MNALLEKAKGNRMLFAFRLSGTHPLCCRGDRVIIEAVEFVIGTLQEVQKTHPYPIAPRHLLTIFDHLGRHWQLSVLDGIGKGSAFSVFHHVPSNVEAGFDV